MAEKRKIGTNVLIRGSESLGRGVYNGMIANGRALVIFDSGWRWPKAELLVWPSYSCLPPARVEAKDIVLTAKQEKQRANLGLTVEQYQRALYEG